MSFNFVGGPLQLQRSTKKLMHKFSLAFSFLCRPSSVQCGKNTIRAILFFPFRPISQYSVGVRYSIPDHLRAFSVFNLMQKHFDA